MIWSLMNTMQIIVHLPLLNISFPPNAQTISELFLTLASFDVIPHKVINEFIFNFDKLMEMKEARFEQMGYGENNFILNAGTSFWFLIIWILLAFLSKGLSFVKSKSKRFDSFRQKLRKQVFFQIIIRIYLECYLELLVCSLINVKNLNWKTDGEWFSSILSILASAILTITP